MRAHSAPDPQSRRLVIGCATLAAVLCLGLAVPLYSLAQRGESVKAAVRASFPGFCNEWRDKIVVSPNPLGLFTAWDVKCVSGYFAGPAALGMTVNVLTCEARPPVVLSLKVEDTFGGLVAPGRRMPVCP